MVEAEAEVPKAMAEVFRQGNLGIMDYYRMKNVQADTPCATRSRGQARNRRTVPVLLVLAWLVQRMRMRQRSVEEAQGNESEMASVPVATKKRVPIRGSRRPSEASRIVRPTTDASPAARRWQPRVTATARDMRRGIVLMAVIGPCRGFQPCSVSGELDRGSGYPGCSRPTRRHEREPLNEGSGIHDERIIL